MDGQSKQWFRVSSVAAPSAQSDSAKSESTSNTLGRRFMGASAVHGRLVGAAGPAKAVNGSTG